MPYVGRCFVDNLLYFRLEVAVATRATRVGKVRFKLCEFNFNSDPFNSVWIDAAATPGARGTAAGGAMSCGRCGMLCAYHETDGRWDMPGLCWLRIQFEPGAFNLKNNDHPQFDSQR